LPAAAIQRLTIRFHPLVAVPGVGAIEEETPEEPAPEKR
jgi:hypothetical protein